MWCYCDAWQCFRMLSMGECFSSQLFFCNHNFSLRLLCSFCFLAHSFYIDWLCLINFMKSLSHCVGPNWLCGQLVSVFCYTAWYVVEIAAIHYVRSHLTSCFSSSIVSSLFFYAYVICNVKKMKCLNIFHILMQTLEHWMCVGVCLCRILLP